MTAIWLLSSRGRPKEAQAAIDACQNAGMSSPGVLYVDETVDEYRRIRLPRNWTIHYEPVWGSLQASLQWCFHEYPDATQYGWLADDTRPLTRGWDKRLEAEAGRWNLSYADDLWFAANTIEHDRLLKGQNLSSGLCWGGDLVRTVGWWALPGVRQAGIDTAWCEIVRPLQLHRYTPDVVVEHMNWRTGKRPKDAVDDWQRGGDNYVERDIVAFNHWVWSEQYRLVLAKVRKAMGFGEELTPRLELAFAQSEADELLAATGGVKSNRILRLQELYAEVQRIDANEEQTRLDQAGG